MKTFEKDSVKGRNVKLIIFPTFYYTMFINLTKGTADTNTKNAQKIENKMKTFQANAKKLTSKTGQIQLFLH